MNKFKNVLTNEELANKSLVKEYLEYSFRKRRAKKNSKLYINLTKIYKLYPSTIKHILDEIPRLGYYKDYFYILSYSKNNDLDLYIYHLIISQLNLDLDNLKYNLPISTLGKWLPRETSKLNLACNFVDKFNALFFPSIKNKFDARRQYRHTKSLLNKKLGTIECFLCANDYGSIDYHKVAPYALKKKKRILLKHEDCTKELELYEEEILNKLSLSEFIRDILLNKYSVEKMEAVWLEKKFCHSIPFLADVITGSVCIVDLSNNIFNKNSEFFVLGIALIGNYFSTSGHIMVGRHIINPQGNIRERLTEILKYIGPCANFDCEDCYSKFVEKKLDLHCLIFVTDKKIINDVSLLKNWNLKLLHIVPDHQEYQITYYNRENSIGETNLIHHKKKISSKKIIQLITSQSTELNGKPMQIVFLILLFGIIFFWKFYYSMSQ